MIAFWILYSRTTCWSKTGDQYIEGRERMEEKQRDGKETSNTTAFSMLYSGPTCWSNTGASSIWREGRAVRRSRDIERTIEKRFCFRFSSGGPTARGNEEPPIQRGRGRRRRRFLEVRIAIMYSRMLVFCSGGALRSPNRHRANVCCKPCCF